MVISLGTVRYISAVYINTSIYICIYIALGNTKLSNTQDRIKENSRRGIWVKTKNKDASVNAEANIVYVYRDYGADNIRSDNGREHIDVENCVSHAIRRVKSPFRLLRTQTIVYWNNKRLSIETRRRFLFRLRPRNRTRIVWSIDSLQTYWIHRPLHWYESKVF